MTATEHWTHVEHTRRYASAADDVGAGPWTRVTRAVCQCGWASPWYFAGPVAVEAGLAHSARPEASS